MLNSVSQGNTGVSAMIIKFQFATFIWSSLWTRGKTSSWEQEPLSTVSNLKMFQPTRRSQVRRLQNKRDLIEKRRVLADRRTGAPYLRICDGSKSLTDQSACATHPHENSFQKKPVNSKSPPCLTEVCQQPPTTTTTWSLPNHSHQNA